MSNSPVKKRILNISEAARYTGYSPGDLDLASLTRKKAAELCGVSLVTFDKWRKCYGMPYYTLPGLGNQTRYNIKEIRKWQEQFKHQDIKNRDHPSNVGIRKVG